MSVRVRPLQECVCVCVFGGVQFAASLWKISRANFNTLA